VNVFSNRSAITPREGEKELSYISFTQQTEKNEGGKMSNRLQLGMSGLRLKREGEQNKKENMREGGEV